MHPGNVGNRPEGALEALARGNARLVERLDEEAAERQRAERKLRTLTAFASEMACFKGSTASLLDRAVEATSDLVGGLCVATHAPSELTPSPMTWSVHHRDPALATSVRALMEANPVGVGVTGQVLASGRPVLVTELTVEQHRQQGDASNQTMMHALDVICAMAVPLAAAGRIAGALTVARLRGERSLTVEELNMLQAIAAPVAVALANNVSDRAQAVPGAPPANLDWLDAVPDPLLLIDQSGTVADFNRAAEQLLGYPRYALIGQPIERVFVEPVEGTGATAPLRFLARRRDGIERVVELTATRCQLTAESFISTAFREVTDGARPRLPSLPPGRHAHAELLAPAVHELRTPLNAIIGFASLMHSGKAGPIADLHRNYLGDVLGSARHLKQIIDEILDEAKAQHRGIRPRLETVELDVLVGEVKDRVRGVALARGITLTSEVTAGPAKVDPKLVKQLLLNLVSNALKFTPSGGTISVRAVEDASGFRIDVCDTGIGIRAEDLPRLFNEYEQVGPVQAGSEGSGLGLALARRIAEAHGGRVEVTSTVGAGSTFSVVLPRVAPAKGALVRG